MELVMMGRLLRRRWPLVIAGFLISLAVGGYLSRGGSTPELYEATAQVLVDARTPLIASTTVPVNGTATGATIAERAIFLADLVSSSSNAAVIAHAAGLRSDELSITTPTFQPVTRQDTLLPAGELPQLSAQAAGSASTNSYYQLLLNANYPVPVITVTATTPTKRQATELTQAAVGAMQATTRAEVATVAAAAKVSPDAGTAVRDASTFMERSIAEEALTVKQLGTLQLGTVPATTGQLPLGIAAAFVLFAVWCFCVAVVARRGRRTRRWARRRRLAA